MAALVDWGILRPRRRFGASTRATALVHAIAFGGRMALRRRRRRYRAAALAIRNGRLHVAAFLRARTTAMIRTSVGTIVGRVRRSAFTRRAGRSTSAALRRAALDGTLVSGRRRRNHATAALRVAPIGTTTLSLKTGRRRLTALLRTAAGRLPARGPRRRDDARLGATHRTTLFDAGGAQARRRILRRSCCDDAPRLHTIRRPLRLADVGNEARGHWAHADRAT